MVSTGVNYLAILVAGVAYMILGAIWYSPALFGNAWMKGIGKTKEQVSADYTAFKMVWALIGSLIAAYGIARILSYMVAGTMWDAVLIALMAAICFVLTTTFINQSMEGRPTRLFFINGLYNLIGFFIMGLIIGGWR